MVVASINCFNVPIEIALDPPITKNIFYKLLSVLTDLLFMADVIINFNTTYEWEDGTVVYERKLIAKRYLNTRFAVDFLSAIPLDFIAKKMSDGMTDKRIKLFSLLKLTRMLRLSRLIRTLNVHREFKVKLKLIKMVI